MELFNLVYGMHKDADSDAAFGLEGLMDLKPPAQRTGREGSESGFLSTPLDMSSLGMTLTNSPKSMAIPNKSEVRQIL